MLNTSKLNISFTNFQAVRCQQHCGQLVLACDLDEHYKLKCTHRHVECPNLCGWTGKAKDLPDHIGNGEVELQESGNDQCRLHSLINELRDLLATEPETPFPIQQLLAKINETRIQLREDFLANSLYKEPNTSKGKKSSSSYKNSKVSLSTTQTLHKTQKLPFYDVGEASPTSRRADVQELRSLLEKTQKYTSTEKQAFDTVARLAAISKEKAEHVLALLTTRASADNFADTLKDRMEMCWRVWTQYDICCKLYSDRDTLRPSEEILLKFADFELSTGLARKDVPRIARAIEFIQKNYQYIPDDPLTRDQKQDTLRGLTSILHEKKILQLKQYPTFHKWFLDLCGEPYSEQMVERVKECLEKVLCNPNLGDPATKVTPLIALCRRGYSDLVEELLYVDSDATFAAMDGKTALHVVCEKRDQKCLARFCATTKYKERNIAHLVDKRDKGGRTPLMLLCRHVVDEKFLSVLEMVVESGCRPMQKQGDDKNSVHQQVAGAAPEQLPSSPAKTAEQQSADGGGADVDQDGTKNEKEEEEVFQYTPDEILSPKDKEGKTVLHHLLLGNIGLSGEMKCKDEASLRSTINYMLHNGIHATRSRDVHRQNPVILACKQRYPAAVIQTILETISEPEIAAKNLVENSAGIPEVDVEQFVDEETGLVDGDLVEKAEEDRVLQQIDADKHDLLQKDDTGKNPVEWIRHWAKLSAWRKWGDTVEELLMEHGHPKEWDIDLRRLGIPNNAVTFKDPKFHVVLDYEEVRNQQIVDMLDPLEGMPYVEPSEHPESEMGETNKEDDPEDAPEVPFSPKSQPGSPKSPKNAFVPDPDEIVVML
ncbi:unnamed protein product [Amoebophrya sp. A120]|nr:unnamed protein product [Amoebophrya sp. A120]|eukprot:GSA120T00021461001.1